MTEFGKDRFHELIVENRYEVPELINLFGYINVRDYVIHVANLDVLDNPKYTYYFEEVYDECVSILSELKKMYPIKTVPERWI